MITADAGTPIIIETTLQKYTPFGEYADTDPDTPPTISVVDNKGNEKLAATPMTKSATGKYYYVVQTAVDWFKTTYNVQVVAAYSPNTDTHIDKRSFKLE